MSTAGSDPNGRTTSSAPAELAYSPKSDAAPSAGPPAKPKRVAIFRWRGIFALAFGAAVVAIVWLAFGKIFVRRTIQSAASQSLGTQVDIAGLGLDLANTSVELRGIAIAHPFDHNRNLVEANVARVVLLPEALLEKKVVIRELTLDGVRANTRRSTPARDMPGGFAPRALQALQQWRKQFNVPLLSLTPLDTVKSLILNPSQLSTVKRVQGLGARGDSLRGVMTAGMQGIQFRETVDSAQALFTRLNGQTPRTLGLTGTRNAINDVRRLTTRIDSTRKRLDQLVTTAQSGMDSLVASVRAIDDARKADYAFARGLLKLPTVDAPNIGPALFGNVSIDAFEQTMYWITLAREYAPPGLLPRETPGPKRIRRAGSTIHFVKQAVYPNFLLEKALVAVSLDESTGAARGEYKLTASDVTTEPALVRRPTRFSFSRAAAGSAVEGFAVTGALDHAGATPREVIEVRADGIKLPGFPLPATPLRAEFARARSVMKLDLNGDAVTGSWSVSTPDAAWVIDSAKARSLNTMEQLVVRVIQTIRNVDLSAEIGGTMQAPKLSVRSSLDRAVADGVKSVVGTEVAKAEAKVRAQVDSLAEQAAAPVRARIAELRAEVDQKAKEAQTRLDDSKRQLAERLKTLGGGLIGLP
ncbi:MAG TPA: hypothetical protein VIP11_12500 [Gemmatimonadaceae bacterium]